MSESPIYDTLAALRLIESVDWDAVAEEYQREQGWL